MADKFKPEESATEVKFRKSLACVIADGVKLKNQRAVATSYQTFWLDLVANGPRVVAIECDGPQHTRTNESMLRDLCRDSLVMGMGDIDCIYRFPSCDMWNFRHSVMYALLELEPWLFREDVKDIIKGLHVECGFPPDVCRLDKKEKRLAVFAEFAKSRPHRNFSRLVNDVSEAWPRLFKAE